MSLFAVRYRVLVAIVLGNMTPALAISFSAIGQELAAQYEFNVPAGEAGAALQALALQSKSQIAFSPDQVASIRTPALVGKFTVSDALSRLLGHTKLSYRVTDTGSIVVYDKSQHSENIPARSASPPSGPATEGPQLEEVVVTAQKRRENLQVVPVAVTALDSQALENARVENVMDLGGLAPNVYVMHGASVAGSNATPFMTIRGIQSNVTGTVQTDSGIAIYVDGVYLARASAQSFDLADVQEIEILRGPQGTLFGRNSVGGAVNLITQDPSGEFRIKEDLSVGNFGEFRTKTRVDFDEIAGFRLAISYLHSQTDGYMKNLSAGHFVDPSRLTFGSVGPHFSQQDLGSADSDAFIATLTYHPPAIDDLTLKYKFDYTGEDSVNSGIQILAVGPSASSFYPPPYGSSKTNRIAGPVVVGLTPTDEVANTQAIGNYLMSWGQSLTVDYNPSDTFEIKNITAYRGLESTISSQLDGGNNLVTQNGSDFIPFFAVFKTSQHQLSNEIDATAKTNYVDVTAGLLYFYEQFHYVGGSTALSAAPGGILPSAPGRVQDGSNTSIAEFAQFTGHLSDDLDMVLGLRHTYDDRASRYPLTPALSAEGVHQRTDWLAGVNYRPLDILLVYAKASSGYISGGSYQGVSFAPETITQFEIGEKVDLFDKRLRFNTAAFWSDFRHYQAFSFSPITCNGEVSCIVNAGAERIWGGEAELTAIPIERVFVSANLGLTRPSLDANQNASAIPTNFAPKWTLGLSGQYDFPEIQGMVPSIRLEANYTTKVDWGDTRFTLPGVPRDFVTPALWLVNARATLARIRLGPADAKISIWGKNIFDKQYFSYIIPGKVIGFVDGSVAEPATYGLDISIRY